VIGLKYYITDTAKYSCITVTGCAVVAEAEQTGANEADLQSPVPAAVAAPSSLAFTIDFGQNSDKPEITDHWKHLTPYRVHAGVQQRSTATKSRSTNKQRTDLDAAGRKTNKV